MATAIHLLAGLNGAGKTTLARRLERSLPAVRFTLDEWMLRLHGLRFDDPRYPEVAAAGRELIWDTASQVLHAGIPVVLDWNLWSRERRAAAVGRAADLDVECHLHYVHVPLETAVHRALVRQGDHVHDLDEAAVRHLGALFEEPTDSEGFVLNRYGSDLRPLD